MPRALEPEIAAAIVRELKAAGYRYVTLDLQGYRLGQPERRTAPAAHVSPNDVERRTRVKPAADRLLSASSASSALIVVLALVFLALHLPYLPASLEDLDSINFALGIRHFDVAHHQPHPPGYPVFILIAKALHAVVPAGGDGAGAAQRRSRRALGVLAAGVAVSAGSTKATSPASLVGGGRRRLR